MDDESDMSDKRVLGPLVFAQREPHAAPRGVEPWKILVVDDDEEVHKVTRLALTGFTFKGRPLRFLDASSGREAVELMRSEQDVAIVLMDVVMETEHAGLDAVEAIRKELGNRRVRIVLRTGHAGQVPERDVVTRYDINDYREKAELTVNKLFTVIHTSLSHYHELAGLAANHHGPQ